VVKCFPSMYSQLLRRQRDQEGGGKPKQKVAKTPPESVSWVWWVQAHELICTRHREEVHCLFEAALSGTMRL
jgi:hypothetical protein